MSTNNVSKRVITVLFDNEPVAVVEITPASDNAEEVDVYHKDAAQLVEIYATLDVARNGISFLNWKENGSILIASDGEIGEASDDEGVEPPWTLDAPPEA